jgi:methyl-accepting chemotaxis protein
MSEPNGEAAGNGLDPSISMAAGKSAGGRWRRRRFLVNRRYQFRVAALVVTLTLVLLVFLNLSLYSGTVQSSRRIVEIAPEFEQYVLAQDRSMVRLILIGSLVFLLGVFLVSILETHKTAGAAFNLSKRLNAVGEGNYEMRLELRRHDNLRELEEPFNRMCLALRERELEEIEALEEIASRTEGSMANELRLLAERKRGRIG